MATERLSMRQLREILRQKLLLGRSHREVVQSLGVGLGTISLILTRAGVAGLEAWASVEGLSEEEVEARLYGPRVVGRGLARPLPDPAWLHAELRRPGVTLALLHAEYLEGHPGGYGYTQFCEHYRRWLRAHRLTMRQVHRGGEKGFVDYAGRKPWLVDPGTGERREVELFLAVLGAWSLTYAQATETQRLPDFLASHVRALEFFGGVPAAIVPDQLRSGVTVPCRYEPQVHRSYEELAAHYGTGILPARPGAPRDKAKVEVAVQIAERWILARLRHATFFSLVDWNVRIRELLEEINARPMRVLGSSRRELFERYDRPALRPLPATRFVFAEWKVSRVNLDYHVALDHHFDSVPHPLVHETLDVRFTATTVEIFHRGERVAAHARSCVRGGYTTDPAHRPKAHRGHLEWSPSRIVHRAGETGPQTAKLAEAILNDRPHPEQGYRSCLGLIRLGKRSGAERLEAACARALAAGARSYRHVDSILKAGLDRRPPRDGGGERASRAVGILHEHLRGAAYYGAEGQVPSVQGDRDRPS